MYFAAKCFAEIKNHDDTLPISKRLLDRFNDVLDYMIIYDAKSNGLSQPDLDAMVDVEIGIIETIGEYWKENPLGYKWLIDHALHNDKLQEFSWQQFLS